MKSWSNNQIRKAKIGPQLHPSAARKNLGKYNGSRIRKWRETGN